PDTSELTPQELDELLNIRDQSPAPAPPFLTTWPGVLVLAAGALLVVGLLAAAAVTIVWRSGFGDVASYQLPYAQLVRLGRWSGTLRPRVSDTPNDLAERP